MGQEKVTPMGTGSVCKASLVWRRPPRVDRGRKLDLGSNGFMQQLPFYILFPKSPITEQGLYPNLIFFAKLNLSKNDSVLRRVGFSGFSSCIWVFLFWYVNPSSHLICPRQYKQHLQQVLHSIRHVQTACFSHCHMKVRDSNGAIQTFLLRDN